MKDRKQPERKFGLFDAVMVGLGGGFGVEIFLLLNYAADASVSGADVVLALLLCGVVNLLTVLSYCELGSAIPEVGSEYTYTKAAYGGLTAFLAGWIRWMSSGFVAALGAIGFSRFAYMLVLQLVRGVPWTTEVPPIITSVTSILIVVIFTVISIRGYKHAGTVIVMAILVTFAVFIAFGLYVGFEPKVYSPAGGVTGRLSGILRATVYTIPTVIGVKAVVASGAQIKDPSKNIPRSLLLCVMIMTIANCSAAYVAVGVLRGEELVGLAGNDTPLLILAANAVQPQVMVLLMTVTGIAAALSSLSTMMMVQASIAQGMSRDGYLPEALLSVHRRFGTPYVAVIVNSLFTVLLAATNIVIFLGYAASFGSLLVFALVNLSLMKLRKKKPFLKRPFKAPLYPVIPVTGIAVSLTLLALPIVIQEETAQEAFTFGTMLILLALMVYQLKMVGYSRLRAAVGGINLGIGSALIMLACFMWKGLVALSAPSQMATFILFGLLISGGICVSAGILNVTAKT